MLIFYKAYLFKYPIEFFAIEVAALLALISFQYLRLFIGSKGNKTESSGTTVLFILMTIPTLLGTFYFMNFQTYVLVGEGILCAIGLFFGIVEFLLALFAAIEFKSLENSQ